MHGEELVVGFGLDQGAGGLDQVQPHHDGRDSSDEKHQGDGSEIEQGDAFVVGGEEPGFDSVAGVQIVNAGLDGNFGDGRAHGAGVLSAELSDLM